MQEIETAIQLWLETAKKHGKPIPLPKGSKIKDPKKHFNVIFPEYLLITVDEYRGKHGLKRFELLACAAERYMVSAN